MVIIYDTREQKPLYKNGVMETLNVGDYTTRKLKGIYHVERKSLQDLYQTLTKGNGRFKYELFRASHHRIQLEVYIEGTYEDFINKRFPKGDERKFTKEGLEKLIKTFSKKYYLVFVWCKSRKDCVSNVQLRLSAMEKKLKNK